MRRSTLGITTLALIDTDCDPDRVDLPIPGNDDGIRSIELIMSEVADAVLAGTANYVTKDEAVAKQEKPAAAAPEASDKAAETAPAEGAAETAESEPGNASTGGEGGS